MPERVLATKLAEVAILRQDLAGAVGGASAALALSGAFRMTRWTGGRVWLTTERVAFTRHVTHPRLELSAVDVSIALTSISQLEFEEDGVIPSLNLHTAGCVLRVRCWAPREFESQIQEAIRESWRNYSR